MRDPLRHLRRSLDAPGRVVGGEQELHGPAPGAGAVLYTAALDEK